MRRSVIGVLPLVVAAVTGTADPWSDWECPGFPCFIVNFFEYRPYPSLKSTCGPVDQMLICDYLKDGHSFPAKASNGTTIGIHEMKAPHPCRDLRYGCWQVDEGSPMKPTCPGGSLPVCYANCGKLALLQVYNGTCYDVCDYQCNAEVA
jgi:hypothetical protein